MAQQLRLEDGRDVRLLDLVGRGSGTTVHRALLLSASGLARPVALKMFDAVSSEEAEDIFENLALTARAVACIDHPNVVRTYECGVWRGKPFLVMELVDGVSLAQLMAAVANRGRRVPADVALYVASEIAAGLSGARLTRDYEGIQLNLVHHGVCASEILLSWRGEVKVSDFAATLARPASSSIRNLKSVVDRAASVAPEVAQGAVGDARSDVFSLGVLLHELFVGPRFPPSLSNTEALRLARQGYVHSYTFKPNLPAALGFMIERALALEPEDRFPNVCAMAFELRRTSFQMGAGDGRHFLQRAIEREWPERADEVTAEHVFKVELPADADADEPKTERIDDLRVPSLSRLDARAPAGLDPRVPSPAPIAGLDPRAPSPAPIAGLDPRVPSPAPIARLDPRVPSPAPIDARTPSPLEARVPSPAPTDPRTPRLDGRVPSPAPIQVRSSARVDARVASIPGRASGARSSPPPALARSPQVARDVAPVGRDAPADRRK